MDYTNYDSPIFTTVQKMNEEIMQKTDDAIYKQVINLGINIDKNSLVKALQQDKERYVEAFEKGYDYAKKTLYDVHAVAKIIEELFGDSCACNFNDIDEWLPYVCEYRDTSCPYPTEGSCWEQYLLHKNDRNVNT